MLGIFERFFLPPPKPTFVSKVKIFGSNEKGHVAASPVVFDQSQSTQWFSRFVWEVSIRPKLTLYCHRVKGWNFKVDKRGVNIIRLK